MDLDAAPVGGAAQGETGSTGLTRRSRKSAPEPLAKAGGEWQSSELLGEFGITVAGIR